MRAVSRYYLQSYGRIRRFAWYISKQIHCIKQSNLGPAPTRDDESPLYRGQVSQTPFSSKRDAASVNGCISLELAAQNHRRYIHEAEQLDIYFDSKGRHYWVYQDSPPYSRTSMCASGFCDFLIESRTSSGAQTLLTAYAGRWRRLAAANCNLGPTSLASICYPVTADCDTVWPLACVLTSRQVVNGGMTFR